MNQKDELMETYNKPLPPMDGMSAEYYRYLKEHELRFQRCLSCGRWRHIPRELCAKCGSEQYEWARSTGLGSVYSWTTTHRPMRAAFAGDVPYAGVVIELDEGPRIASWVTDVVPGDLEAGLRVRAWYDPVTPEVTLLKFKSDKGAEVAR